MSRSLWKTISLSTDSRYESYSYNTLIPVVDKHIKAFGEVLEEVNGRQWYCSEKNLLYLKQNKITSYIKLQDP